VRFTQKRDTLYAILLHRRPKVPEVRISNVTAVPGQSCAPPGVEGNLEWSQNGEALAVRFPSKLPQQAAYAVRLKPITTRQTSAA
jgi:hypothetical protein